MKPYKSVKQCSEAEYTVNRSRFIGRCFPVDSEEAALCLLGDIRKKHWDATHNCFAYRIGENAAARFSDDGEPGGTAGKPIMDVLTGRGLTNVLCVVTRYSKSAADAVTKAGMVSYLPGTILDIPMDYSRYGALEGFIRANAEVRNVAFAQNVVVTVAVEDTNLLKFMKEVTERSDGRCTPVTIGTGYMKKEEI